MYGTGQEWHRLIYEHGLTISTNLLARHTTRSSAYTLFTSTVACSCWASC